MKIKKPFKLIRALTQREINKVLKQVEETEHFKERLKRFTVYTKEGLDFNDIALGFEVDKMHVNGPELHIITNEAFIIILNSNTKKLITVKAARGAQIIEYLNSYFGEIPITFEYLVDKAYKRQHGNKPLHRVE